MLKWIRNLKKKECKHVFKIVEKKFSPFQKLTDDETFTFKVRIKCKKCGLEKEEYRQM